MVGQDLVRIETEFLRNNLRLVNGHIHVRPAILGRVGGPVTDINAPLGLNVRAAGPLTPSRRREDHVGVEIVRGVTIDFLYDHEHLGERRSHQRIQVRHVYMCGVHPEHRVEPALQCPLHHSDDHAWIGQRRRLGQPLFGHMPCVGDMLPPSGILDRLVEWQPAGQSAHQALAHRVGLARLRVAAASGSSDVACQKMQIDNADRVVLTVKHLVVADAPKTEHPAATASPTLDRSLGPHPGDVLDGLDRHPTVFDRAEPLDHLRRRILGQHTFLVRLPSVGMPREPFVGHTRLRILFE